MPRKAREQSALEVRRLKSPGRWAVGGVDGLALQITEAGARSWVLRIIVAGKRREIGLGSFPSVALADARDRARVLRAQVVAGAGPVVAKREARLAASAIDAARQTFSEVAEQYITQHAPSWKNAKHAAQWTSTLRDYAEPVIGATAVGDLTTAHILRVLEPIWSTKTAP